MPIPRAFVDELRGRAGLADVIGRRVRLQRKGREHLGLCPFHKEKTPSFTVNEEKGFYHCFGCGAHGSVFDFVMETEGLTFPEVVEKLAQEAGLEVPRDSPEEQERQRQRQTLYDVTEKAAAYFERQLRMPEGRRSLEYLKSRGLDDAQIARFRLGFAADARGALKAALMRDGVPESLLLACGLLIKPDDGGRASYDRFRGRVMFPIADSRGRVIAFGGRILGVKEAGSADLSAEAGSAKAEGATGNEQEAGRAGLSAEALAKEEGPSLLRRSSHPGCEGRAGTETTRGVERPHGPRGRDRDETNAPKYLNSPETPLFDKGAVLYGRHLAARAARKAGGVVVVEGYMDVIALHSAGLDNAVAPLGTALSEEQVRLLWRMAPEPVLCFDGDVAGAAAAVRAAGRALPLLVPGFGLRFALLPAGRDPAEVVAIGGEAAMRAVIESALPLSEFLWRAETAGRNLNRPEERAAAHERLKGHARRIEDSTMRRMFAEAFGDRLWGRRRKAVAPPRPLAASRGGHAAPHGVRGTPPPAPPRPASLAARVMLATVINHPEIYDAACEDLGRMTFDDAGLDALRQAALSDLAAGGRSREELAGALAALGHARALAAVLSRETYAHGFFARPEASAADAAAGFGDAARLMTRRRLEDEIAAAATAPGDGPSLERLRALKQEAQKPWES